MTSSDTPAIVVPSGQAVQFLDVVTDAPGPDGPTARFRFLAPAIAREGGTVDFDTAAADMLHLCETVVLPLLADAGQTPSQVVISLSDRAVGFGEAAPEATQFFEAYRLENGRCIWEAF
jgi:hypothetical protein